MKKIFIAFLCGLFCAGTVYAQSGDTGYLTWEIVDNVLIISGDDAMPDYTAYYTANAAPWHIYRSDIEKVVICEGVTYIGDNAFDYDYDKLISITIPASVVEFGDNSFAGCFNLNEFVYLGLEPIAADYFCSFFSGINLFTCTLRVPSSAIDKYSTAMLWETFQNIEAINATITVNKEEVYFYPGIDVSVIINSVTVSGISPYVVAWKSSNTDVATVDHTGTVTVGNPGSTVITGYIGSIETSYTFIVFTQGGVDGQITWGILDNVLTIRGNGDMPDYQAGGTYGAPWQNYSFSSIDINDGVMSIGKYAFFGCSSFTSVSIPGTVTTIGHGAFCVCSNLISIEIPSSVLSIGNANFSDCTSMTSITVDSNNPAYSSEDGVLFNKYKTTLIAFPAKKTGSYTIPESVETIGDYAFFASGLTSVVIPCTVTSIGAYAFSSCLNLTSIVIPASVTNIDDRAFYSSKNLSEVINLSLTPQVIPSEVFLDVDLDVCLLRVYDIAAYGSAAGWKEFKNIVALNVGLTLDEEVIYLMPGATTALTATVSGDVTIPEVIRWEIGNTDIATVDDTGMVTAVNPGSTVITVSFGDLELICTVTVVEEGASSIEGTVYYEGADPITVYLYMKMPEDMEKSSLTKAKVVGGYVLLTKTVPKANGQYSFENLPKGSYKVDVEIHGYESEISREIKISVEEIRSDINFTVNTDTRVITIELTTGANEFSDVGLSIYPNPFYGLLHIEGAEGSTLRIFTVDGKPVHVQTVTGADETIQLERLPVGMYIIRIENGGRAKMVKIIKIQ